MWIKLTRFRRAAPGERPLFHGRSLPPPRVGRRENGQKISKRDGKTYFRRLSILADHQLKRDWMHWTSTMMNTTVTSIMDGMRR